LEKIKELIECPFCNEILEYDYKLKQISAKCFKCKKLFVIQISGIYNDDSHIVCYGGIYGDKPKGYRGRY